MGQGIGDGRFRRERRGGEEKEVREGVGARHVLVGAVLAVYSIGQYKKGTLSQHFVTHVGPPLGIC